MKERPILFSTPMVLALLAGTKTQTRRLVKGDVVDVGAPEWWGTRRVVHLPRCRRAFCESVGECETACGGFDCAADGQTERSPYGVAGDRLWVKETWRTEKVYDALAPRNLPQEAPVFYEAEAPEPPNPFGKGRPSIFMMRHMSRLNLEVTGVRVERLQDISEADAVAEGVEYVRYRTAKEAYSDLWESINGAGSWALNPWVWCLTFRRVTS